MPDRGLTHLDPLGRARMVDVTPKEPTHRRATARCKVWMSRETTDKIAVNAITKGDVLAVARVAGIQAAKRTPDLIPLCHQLTIGSVYVNFTIEEDNVEVEAQVDTVDRTGVEMEAMTACSVAALTIYDMCKSVDRSMVIGELTLWEKTGGRSGTYRRKGGGGAVGRAAVATTAEQGSSPLHDDADDDVDAYAMLDGSDARSDVRSSASDSLAAIDEVLEELE
jgi:cyclic pyranopterin phosphate synthase